MWTKFKQWWARFFCSHMSVEKQYTIRGQIKTVIKMRCLDCKKDLM